MTSSDISRVYHHLPSGHCVTCDSRVSSVTGHKGTGTALLEEDTVRWDQGRLLETSRAHTQSLVHMGHLKPKGKALGIQ